MGKTYRGAERKKIKHALKFQEQRKKRLIKEEKPKYTKKYDE